MGDTVNTAARIMVTASPGVIHAHPAVFEHARTLYHTNPEGPFVFKGKAQPQVVYRVGEELGPRHLATRDSLPLLGRDEELAALRRHVEAVIEGRGGVVTIVGAAGLGKSRLVDEALGDAWSARRSSRCTPSRTARATAIAWFVILCVFCSVSAPVSRRAWRSDSSIGCASAPHSWSRSFP